MTTRGGRPPFMVLLMIKLLMIKQLYNLSDDQVECQALVCVPAQRFFSPKLPSWTPD